MALPAIIYSNLNYTNKGIFLRLKTEEPSPCNIRTLCVFNDSCFFLAIPNSLLRSRTMGLGTLL